MANPDSEHANDQREGGYFPPTHWTLVINAGRDSSSEAREAFGRLYENYLGPLLAYLRWEGRTAEQSQELVQSFFEFLLQRHGLAQVRREGKFRSWLLVCLKHYLADLYDKNHALKRGGHAPHLPLRSHDEETGVDPPHPGRSPDQEYDRQFAIRFLELVIVRLEREYRARGKGAIFESLHPFLLEKQGAESHAEIGQQLNLSENAVSQEISRLRKRYREVFDEELLNLVGSSTEIDAEKRFLFAALRT